MARQQVTGERHWYVLHTYSGYEDSVAYNLKQRIESMNMQDKIFEAMVPKEKRSRLRTASALRLRKRFFRAMFWWI